MSSVHNNNPLMDHKVLPHTDIDTHTKPTMEISTVTEVLDDGEQIKDEKGKQNSCLENGEKFCVVCLERAAGVYFGALVCLPCKSFYIRCTKDDPNPTFVCSNGNRCDIIGSNRLRCQSCRYEKCLDVGMCRKEKPDIIHPTEGQEVCQVCNDIANGCHFGIYTCEGCKKFYRRGMKEADTYECKVDRNCPINPRTRNDCRFCRFQKCITVGMSRQAIKMGRPKKASTTATQHTQVKKTEPNGKANAMISLETQTPRPDETAASIDQPMPWVTNTINRPQPFYGSWTNCAVDLPFTGSNPAPTEARVHQDSYYQPVDNGALIDNHIKSAESEFTHSVPDQILNEDMDWGSFLNILDNQEKALNQHSVNHSEDHSRRKNELPPCEKDPSANIQFSNSTVFNPTITQGVACQKSSPTAALLVKNELQTPHSKSLEISFGNTVDNKSPDPPNDRRHHQDMENETTNPNKNREHYRSIIPITTEYLGISHPPELSMTDSNTVVPAPGKSSQLYKRGPPESDTDSTGSKMFCVDYWTMHASINTTSPFSGVQRDMMTMLQRGYNTMVEEADESSVYTQTKTMDAGEDAGVNFSTIKNRIIRNIKASLNFAEMIPGFSDLDKEDQIHVSKYGGFHMMIILAGREQYMPNKHTFKYFWNFPLPTNHPSYNLRRRLLDAGRKIFEMKLDQIEAAGLSCLALVSTDWLTIKDIQKLAIIKQPILESFISYVIDKHGANIGSDRIRDMFNLMPEMRVLSLEHAQHTTRMMLTLDEPDLPKLYGRISLQ